MVVCLAEYPSLHNHFVDLEDLIEIATLNSVSAEVAQASLLSSLQAGSALEAHMKRFHLLADLTGASEAAIPLLF